MEDGFNWKPFAGLVYGLMLLSGNGGYFIRSISPYSNDLYRFGLLNPCLPSVVSLVVPPPPKMRFKPSAKTLPPGSAYSQSTYSVELDVQVKGEDSLM